MLQSGKWWREGQMKHGVGGRGAKGESQDEEGGNRK